MIVPRLGQAFFAALVFFCTTASVVAADKASSRINQLTDKALQLYLTQDYKNAEVVGREAKAAADRDLVPSSEVYQNASLNLATILLANGAISEATSILTRLVEIQAKTNITDTIKLQTLALLLQNYPPENPTSDKLQYLDRFIVLSENMHGNKSPTLIGPLNERAVTHYANGNGEACVADTRRIIDIQKANQMPSSDNFIGIRTNLAMCELRTRNFATAIPLFRALVRETQSASPPDSEDGLLALSNLGFALDQAGQITEAATTAEEVLEKRRAFLGLADEKTLLSMQNLASAYLQLGRYGDAAKLYESVIDQYDQSHKVDKWKVGSYQGLAETYFQAKRYDKALQYLDEGDKALLGLSERDVSYHSNSMRIRSSIYSKKGDADNAMKAYQKFVEAADSSTPAMDMIVAFGNLATLASNKGDNAAASRYIQKALDIQEATGISTDQTVIRQARVFLRLGAVEKALRALEELRSDIAERPGATAGQIAAVSNVLALSNWLAGNHDRTVELLKPIIENVRLYEGTSTSDARPDEDSSSEIAIEGGNLAISIAMTDPSPPIVDVAAEFVLNFKNRVGDSNARLRSILQTAPPASSVGIAAKSYLALRNEVAGLSRRIAEGDNTLLVRLREVQDQMDAKEREVASLTSAGSFPGRDELVRIADVKEHLEQGAALVEFFVYYPARVTSADASDEDRYGAMILTRQDKQPTFVDLAAAKEVRALVANISAEFAKGPTGAETTKRLYDVLLSKILPALSQASHLYISPAGVLGAVPFDMLEDPEGRKFIESGLRYSFVASGRFLTVPVERTTDSMSLVGFGGADFDTVPQLASTQKSKQRQTIDSLYRSPSTKLDNLTSLPSTDTEVRLVGQLWKEKTGGDVILNLGADATEERLREVTSPTVLHLATHGITVSLTQGDTLLPSLQVAVALSGANKSKDASAHSDGIAFGYELEQMNLRGTKLVVLSACETGIGLVNNYEGIIAVEQSFRRAGAEAVLATIHPISDSYTALFMRDFYATWLSMTSPDADEALRQVKLSWLHSNNQEMRDPLLWAPFVIINARGHRGTAN